MRFVGIIPARFSSHRFPGKPLCNIAGKTMIHRTYESVMKWGNWDRVIVATDDWRIMDECEKNDIPCMMTSESHKDCLDRAGEVAKRLEIGKDETRYIVIQGDEPFFNVETLDGADYSHQIINFYTESPEEERYDEDCVKVVFDKNGKALYFSRYSIPYHNERTKRNNDPVTVYKQIGVYAFSFRKLMNYISLVGSSLEDAEGIGLMRLLEFGETVNMVYTQHDSVSIDTPSDLERIQKNITEENAK